MLKLGWNITWCTSRINTWSVTFSALC